VNNAGGGDPDTLMEATPERVQRDFGLNTFSTIYMIQAVIGAGKMPRGGRIINVGTIASKLGMSVSAVYAAAKAAQDSLTASWAAEVGSLFCLPLNSVLLDFLY
jgi:NAD(P)-dependent dehydrogenase (short-subunit alcohol dehydrogenase family)